MIKLSEGCEYTNYENGNYIIEFTKNETYGIKYKRLIKMKGQKAISSLVTTYSSGKMICSSGHGLWY